MAVSKSLITSLRDILEPLRVDAPPVVNVPEHDLSWVRPEMVCTVEFLELTFNGHLRAPSFRGLDLISHQRTVVWTRSVRLKGAIISSRAAIPPFTKSDCLIYILSRRHCENLQSTIKSITSPFRSSSSWSVSWQSRTRTPRSSSISFPNGLVRWAWSHSNLQRKHRRS